jgi:hypothetical protein
MPHVSLSLAAFTLAAGCSPYLSVYGLAYRGQAHSGARNQPVATDGAFRMNGHRLRRSETDGEHLRDVRAVGHYGTGELEIRIRNDDDFERAKPLLIRSYEAR